MSRKLILLLAALFFVSTAAPVLAQTEDEIVAQYLKKADKKRDVQKKDHVIFMSLNFSYGKLPNNNPYNDFYVYANDNITNVGSPYWPMVGIWRSKQFGADFGVMISRKTALRIGFDYWLKMGSRTGGDFDFDIAPLGVQNDFTLVSEVKVYGFMGGVDYYLLNGPDSKGNVVELGVKLGLSGGYYMTTWDIWDGSSSYNLSTQTYDESAEPLKGSAPAGMVTLGLEYPLGLFGLVADAQAGYLFLNFKNVHTYNNIGEELYMTYSDESQDRVNLDFSGLRARIELKKFFSF